MTRKSFAARDQALSGFAAPLGRLCDALPATAAALVDGDGETVDYAGSSDPFDVRVAAAEAQLLFKTLTESGFGSWRDATELVVRGSKASFSAVRMEHGYLLVIQLPYRSFRLSHRALCEAIRELSIEAELTVPARYQTEEWLRVDVQDEQDAGHRPSAVWLSQCWTPVEVVGRYFGEELVPREVAYRIRLATGEEATVVRERLGKWYSDRLLGQ
jgi:hypothetical protein